jgi:ATP-dependent exoDNAse (exonuclease V) alpha subunit
LSARLFFITVEKLFFDMKNLELNDDFVEALRRLEDTSDHIFITGRAGTGKSTLLSYFREHTKKSVAIVAPTGVAAVNVRGQTIHSFFGFKPDVTLAKIKKLNPSWDTAKLFKKLQTIVIDEISMVRADLLDCIDKFLRINGPKKTRPFGGIQMVFIGDVYQLPPVVTSRDRETFRRHYPTPYFFSAEALSSERGFSFVCLELEKIYRQRDPRFIKILNAIRTNTASPDMFEILNERHDPSFEPTFGTPVMYLTTTNDLAGLVNRQRLDELDDELHVFNGRIEGNFEQNALPTDEALYIKIGAQVMLLNNDSLGRWVNGTLGTVVDIVRAESAAGEPDTGTLPTICVQLSDGEVVEVQPYRWDMYEYYYNADRKSVETSSIGSFKQYPLKLAWAMTIHKSQGKTFDQVILDIGRGTFAHGQLYVALSRCRTLQGLVLRRPLSPQHVLMDPAVTHFMNNVTRLA